MKKRMFIMLVVVGLLLGGLVGFNMFKAHMIQQYMANAPVPTATVTAMKADFQQWQPRLTAVGTLRAVRGVDVTTEIAGLVRTHASSPGDEVKSGQVLVELNADADIAPAAFARSGRGSVRHGLRTRQGSSSKPQAISKAQFDADAADLKDKRAQVGRSRQRWSRRRRCARRSRAGWASRTVNPGQYLNTGDKLVTLQAIDPIFVDF